MQCFAFTQSLKVPVLSWRIKTVAAFLREESGATAIAVLPDRDWDFAIITAVQGIGPQLNTKFASINSSLK